MSETQETSTASDHAPAAGQAYRKKLMWLTWATVATVLVLAAGIALVAVKSVAISDQKKLNAQLKDQLAEMEKE